MAAVGTCIIILVPRAAISYRVTQHIKVIYRDIYRVIYRDTLVTVDIVKHFNDNIQCTQSYTSYTHVVQ